MKRAELKGMMIQILSITFWLAAGAVFAQEPSPDSASVEAGRKFYMKWCVNCHGPEGQGDGPGANFLFPRPRNFTFGLYKISSTESGELPADEDLSRTIANGIPGTGMPAWKKVLGDKERLEVVQFIKTFSRKFARAKAPPKVITIGPRVPSSPESIEKGWQLFQEVECWKCHGQEGRGNGPSAAELENDFGERIWPANLRKPWNFRGGNAPEDIYKRLIGGVAGTPMPSFATSLDNEKAWHVVNFVQSLASQTPPEVKVVLPAKWVDTRVPDDPNDPIWEAIQPTYFRLVGQVTIDPRMFTPSIDAVFVKAVYNDDEIGFMLTWDDRTHSLPTESGLGEDKDASPIYADAIAVQLPVKIPPGNVRPYFIMGDATNPVYLLRWASDTESVGELNAKGQANVVEQKPDGSVAGKGVFHEGQYRVVIRRPLRTNDENDLQFEAGKFIPIAFTAWDGSNGEKDGQRSLSAWYFLLLEPPASKTIYAYIGLLILGAVGIEFWFVGRVRRSHKNG